MDFLLSFFISNAYADNGATPGSGMGSILLLVVFILIFYFLLWRPQSKRAKEHRAMVTALNKGDEVITNGGILGKISEVDNEFIVLTIANNVNIKVQKHAVATVVPKGTTKATPGAGASSGSDSSSDSGKSV